MIYRDEEIYKKLNRDSLKINNYKEFMRFYKPQNAKPLITEEMLLPAFSTIRLGLGQNLKLDRICFLLGNGCSVYAGSHPTTDFKITDVVDDISAISCIVDTLKKRPLEEQFNALLIVREYFDIVGDTEKASVVAKVIISLKEHFLKEYVNSIQYNKLTLHEIMLRKLRSLGCLKKVNFYTINYDLALEYSLDKLSIEYANGFSGFVNRNFDPNSLRSANCTKLIKMHGSVNWNFDKKTKTIKEMQPNIKNGKLHLQNVEPVLIYPSTQKLYQTYDAPYSELMRNMLDEFESCRNVIIVLGYRYADEHINEILVKAIAKPNNIFYFFDYENSNCDFIKKIREISESTPNINIFVGKFLGDFETFVKYILPAVADKTDEEKIVELLHSVMEKDAK